MNPLLEFLTFIGIIKTKKLKMNNESENLEVISEFAPILLNTYPIVVHSVTKEKKFEILNSKNNQKGVLEDYFYDFLTENLKGILYRQITNSVSIKILDKNYEPDFFIKANNKNFCIEIDEPYTLNYEGNFIPIHYIGIDEDRNKMMSKAGISVIRFSEEQIMKYPNECIKFIEEFIEKENAEMINEVNAWSKEDCCHLIEIKYRNSYLPIEFQNQLSKSDYSFRSLRIEQIKRLYDRTKVSIRVNDYDIIVSYDVFEKSFFENEFIAKNDDLKIFHECIFLHPNFIQPFRIEGFFKINKQYLNLRDNKFKLIVDDKDKRLIGFFDIINREIAIKKQ